MNRINKSNSPRSVLEFDSILYHHDGEDGGGNNIKHQLKQQQQQQQYDIIHHLEKLDTSSSESMAEMAIECIYIILSNDSKVSSSPKATSETNQPKTTKPTCKYSKEYKRTIQMKDGNNEEKKEQQQQETKQQQQQQPSSFEVEEYRYFHILASIVHAMKRRQGRQHYLHSSLSSKFYSVSLSCLSYCFQLSNNGQSKTCGAVLLRQFITIGGIELVVDNIMKSYPTCLEIQSNSFDLLMKLVQSYDYDDVTYNNSNNNTTIVENLFLGIVQAMMDIKYHPQQQQQQKAQYSKACNDIAKILLEKPYYRPYLIKTVNQVASSVVGYMKQIEQQQQHPVVKQQQLSLSTTTTMATIDEEEQSTKTSSSTTTSMNVKKQHQKENVQQQQTQCVQKLSVCHDIIDITIRATVYIL